jgi:type II secretion system protein C
MHRLPFVHRVEKDETLMKRLFLMFILSSLFGVDIALANPFDYTVLGVITSAKDKKGVALLKQKSSGKVSASKQGDEVLKGMKIVSIMRKTVTFSFEKKTYELSVGDESPKELSGSQNLASTPADNLSGVVGIERQGNTLKVSKSLKDSLTGGEGLNKILMQAATIPYVENGRLLGFRILEIDQGSIFDVAGLKDGDIITHINDQPINDAGLAIRALNSLKQASNATFNYLRGSTPMQLTLQVN